MSYYARANGKGLAGYVITKDGKKLAFAAYVNHVSLAPDPDAAQQVAGQALGEIAAAAYDASLDDATGMADDDGGKLASAAAGWFLRGGGWQPTVQ